MLHTGDKLERDDTPVVLIVDAFGHKATIIAQNLKSQGVTVVIAGNHEKQLALIADVLNVHFCVIDATNIGSILNCIQMVQQKYGRVDGVVHCSKDLLRHVLTEPCHKL